MSIAMLGIKSRWIGNAGTDQDTGKRIIYDPSAFFGHNEYEIGIQKVVLNVVLY